MGKGGGRDGSLGRSVGRAARRSVAAFPGGRENYCSFLLWRRGAVQSRLFTMQDEEITKTNVIWSGLGS